MALNAAWPLLADAKPDVPDLSSEICTASGLEHPDSGAPAKFHSECLRHCALSSLAGERGAALSAQTLALPEPTPGSWLAPATAEAPRFNSVHHPGAPPRAPPVLS